MNFLPCFIINCVLFFNEFLYRNEKRKVVHFAIQKGLISMQAQSL